AEAYFTDARRGLRHKYPAPIHRAGGIPERHSSSDKGIQNAIPVEIANYPAVVESIYPERVVRVMQTRLVLQHGAGCQRPAVVPRMGEHIVLHKHANLWSTAQMDAVARGVQYGVELDVHKFARGSTVMVPWRAVVDSVHVDGVSVVDRGPV